MRILVLGAGVIGSVYASRLSEVGNEVTDEPRGSVPVGADADALRDATTDGANDMPDLDDLLGS